MRTVFRLDAPPAMGAEVEARIEPPRPFVPFEYPEGDRTEVHAVEVAECLGEKLSADSATRSSRQDVEGEDVTPVRVVWVYAVAAEAEKLVAPRLGNVGRPDALA